MRTWGLTHSFISSGYNAVFKCQYLGVELTQVKVVKSLQFLSGKCMAQYCLLTYLILQEYYVFSLNFSI